MNNLEINNNLRKFQFEKSLLFLEYFEDFYSRLEESKNRNSLVKSKNPDFYMLNLCVEYLGKSLFSSFYTFENNVRVEDYKKVFLKSIRDHHIIELFVSKYGKNEKTKKVNFNFLSNKCVYEQDYYIHIKSLLDDVSKVSNLKYEDLNKYITLVKNFSQTKEFIDVLNSNETNKEDIEYFLNFILSYDITSKDFKLKQRKYVSLIYVSLSLIILSLIFNPLHNEFRYFEKIDKELFETSLMYRDLDYFINKIGDIYLSLKEYLHLHFEDLKNGF